MSGVGKEHKDASLQDLNAFISIIPDHRSYHSELVSRLSELLGCLGQDQQMLGKENAPSNRISADLKTFTTQVKRLLNQSMTTLTTWSTMLNIPDSPHAPSKDSHPTKTTTPVKAPLSTERRPSDDTTFIKSSNIHSPSHVTGSRRDRAAKACGGATAGKPQQQDRPKSSAWQALTQIPTASDGAVSFDVYDTQRPTYAHIALLVDVSFLGLRTLEQLGIKSPMALLEVGKARSNLITKTVELGMKRRALQELEIFRDRLLEVAVSIWPSSSFDRAQDSTATTRTKSPSDLSTQSATPESLKESYRHLFRFPQPSVFKESSAIIFQHMSCIPSTNREEVFHTFILLVISLYNNAIRCWLDVRNGSLTHLLYDMLSNDCSPYDWCNLLTKTKKGAAPRSFDSFFRLLFIGAGNASRFNSTRVGQLHAFKLRILGMKYYAAYVALEKTGNEIVWEKVLRCGMEFDRATRENPTREESSLLLAAYRDTYEFIQGIITVDPNGVCFRSWSEHFSFMARKASLGDASFIDFMSLICPTPDNSNSGTVSSHTGDEAQVDQKATKSISPSTGSPRDQAEQISKQLNQVVQALTKLEERIRLWKNKPSNGNEGLAVITTTSKMLKSFEQGIDSYPSQGFSTPNLQNIARVFRSMENFRGIGSKLLESLEKGTGGIVSDKPPPSGDSLAHLLYPIGNMVQTLSNTTIKLWYHAKDDYRAGYKSNPTSIPGPTKLSGARADSILFLFRLHHRDGLASKISQAFLLAALKSTLSMAVEVGDNESLPWISNAFYNLGGSLYHSGKSKEAIQPLEASIQGYRLWLGIDDSLSGVKRNIGVKAPRSERLTLASRYEVLGVCFAAINNNNQARECFDAGISVLPLDAFEELEMAGIHGTNTTDLVVSKLLHRRVKALLTNDTSRFVSTVASIPSLSQMPAHIQGAIQEHECGLLSIFNIRSHRMNHRNQELIAILEHLAANVYRGNMGEYPIRRAKVLIQLVELQQGIDPLPQETHDLAMEAIETLKRSNLAKDRSLENKRNHYLAIAYTWYGILERRRDGEAQKSKHFQIALRLWESVLSQIECFDSTEDAQLESQQKSVAKVLQNLAEPERLYNHLQMLADYLGALDYHVMQVQTYLLMLRLCNGVVPITSETSAEAAMIYTKMAEAYLALGYSGKAKLALDQGKLILEEEPTLGSDPSIREHVLIRWCLAYSRYQTSAGQTKLSSDAFNQARNLYLQMHDVLPLDESRDRFTRSQLGLGGGVIPRRIETQVAKSVILAEASLTRSQLLYFNGCITEAIVDSMKALKHLSRVVSKLSDAVQRAQQDTTVLKSNVLKNPFLDETPADKSGTRPSDSRLQKERQRLRDGLQRLSMQRFHWSTFMLLTETYRHLFKLYLVQGCRSEAEYFQEEGKHIANLVKSAKSVERFMLDQAELNLRKHLWEQSQEILQELATHDDAQTSAGSSSAWEMQDARVQMLYGDLYLATSMFKKSLEAYYRTDEVLSYLMDKSFISALEKLVIREPATPREKKLMTLTYSQDTESMGFEMHPVRRPGGSKSDKDTYDQDLFECVTLSGIKATMGYRTGLIFYCLGQPIEAHGLLEKSKLEDPQLFTVAEYHHVKAIMLIMELEDIMSKDLLYAMVLDSALSVGVFWKTKTDTPPSSGQLLTRSSTKAFTSSLSPASFGPPSLSPSVRATRSNAARFQQKPSTHLSPLRNRAGAGSPRSPMQRSDHFLEILSKAQHHLQEAYRHSRRACPPHIVSGICTSQAYLAVLESSLTEKSKDSPDYLWSMAVQASYNLEKSKAITQQREMRGVLKQKLLSLSPCSDESWPPSISKDGFPEESQSKHDHGLCSRQYQQHTPSDRKRYEKIKAASKSQLSGTPVGGDDGGHAEVCGHCSAGANNDDSQKPNTSYLELLDQMYEQDLSDTGDVNFQRDFLDIIPEAWTVVSLSLDIDRGALYINRMRANAVPIVVRLPLNRVRSRENDAQEIEFNEGSGLDEDIGGTQGEPLTYQEALDELHDILKCSQETLILSDHAQPPDVDVAATFRAGGFNTSTRSQALTKQDKVEWWNKRQRLDERLNLLLGAMESQWLCGLKGLIQSHNTPANNVHLLEFKGSMEWIMSEAASTISLASLDVRVQQKINKLPRAQDNSAQLEISTDLCRAILNLGDQPSYADLVDLIYFLLDSFVFRDASGPAMSSPGGDFAGGDVASPCIEYSGLQLGRVALQIKNAMHAYWLAETEAKNNGFDHGSHVILILDKHLQSFPWESCPVLRGEAVSRVPSIYFLRDRILEQLYRHQQQDVVSWARATKGGSGQAAAKADAERTLVWKDLVINPERTFYVLNPGGDLKNTEQEFVGYVENQRGWDGIVGRPPMDLECINGLSNHELYIYFGHSGGEQYLKSTQTRKLNSCAVSLLLGCSSGSLDGAGEFDPTGTVMHYLLAGCPTVVANLWDVTDKDLDRLSKAVFTLWGLDMNSLQRRDGDSDVVMSWDATRGDMVETSIATKALADQGLSIVEAVKEARDSCRLKYLVGAATVVYGIPCFLKGEKQ
ncbi:hypothetical protein BGW38_010127 [Lunasporangiospora selenospora]|uniref:separase n=1 Tax=Lunasporangiospora selenospora TaxID=979761 RepID=A0A9P6FXE0_9FUNG|nr:hypothetical protein BGW38_010127 [Lunasporangiospora selenospora]